MNCPVCGTRMARFLNPERYECTNTSSHAAILAAQKKQAEGQALGRGNAGKDRPKSAANLKKIGKDKGKGKKK